MELVGLKVDVIVTAGATDTRAAKEATSTIPIVMTQDNDPVYKAERTRPASQASGSEDLSQAVCYAITKPRD
jgi:ABC-type uncharacterized transport system substrate-binding protein